MTVEEIKLQISGMLNKPKEEPTKNKLTSMKVKSGENDIELSFKEDVIADGIEVFVKDAEGNDIPAPDGEYTYMKDEIEVKFTIESGLVKMNVEKKEEETATPIKDESFSKELATLKANITDLQKESDSNKIIIKELSDGITALLDGMTKLSTQQNEKFSAADTKAKDLSTKYESLFSAMKKPLGKEIDDKSKESIKTNKKNTINFAILNKKNK